MNTGKEVINYFVDKDIPDLLFIDAKNSDKKWNIYHETYSFCHILNGRDGFSENIVRGKSNIAVTGNILLFEPGDNHKINKIVNVGDYRVINISQEFLIKSGQSIKHHSIPHLKKNLLSNNILFNALETFHQKILLPSTLLEKQSHLSCCVEKIFEFGTEKKIYPKTYSLGKDIKLVKEYIDEFYDKNIYLDELASLARISKFHLLRSFKKVLGIPPHRYQLYLLIKRISDKIEKGLPINIHFFTDQSHFINCFKRIKGVTPNQYSLMVTGKKLLYY